MLDDFPTIDVAANVARRDSLRDQAVASIRRCCETRPIAAIILGSGLGGLADKIDNAVSMAYSDIPGFAKSTAGGHRGQLILGTLADAPVVAMAGRFHRYEGWSIDDVAFPVHVMHALGASRLIVSNAAGGVNPKLSVGDIIVIRDHINLMTSVSRCAVRPSNLPLSRRGEIYDSAMSAIAMQTALEQNFTAYQGTYLATFGPTYETRAEYRMQRKLGADVAGMSTVPEVLAASELGMATLGLSLVTNVANPDISVKAAHDEVLEAGRDGAGKMESIVRRVLVDVLRI
ncbi:purine-nucleoside phosphorylase [Planctomycetes bacterium K23_9]|uniref:Purine nucleoside phosphorylase n=1 Tax=Stieleria marina TaxID=1930275 RepID=A0A517P2M8_9BACT|nr:Purine nucleoside phosphorylase 1 [Planctomycetes bacterium K23_9]